MYGIIDKKQYVDNVSLSMHFNDLAIYIYNKL